MGVTNQQLADLMSQIVSSTEAHTAAFTAAVEKLIQNDNTHHEAFRRRLEDLALAQVVVDADTKSNTKFREQANKFIIGAILIPVLTAIVALVLK